MTISNVRRVIVVSVWAAAGALVVAGCQMGVRPDVGAATVPASAPAAPAAAPAAAEKGGA